MQLSKEIRQKAKQLLEPVCYLCNKCDGKHCKSSIPGMGGIGNGLSFKRNIEDLEKITITTHYIHDDFIPNTHIQIFNKHFAMPICGAPITGTKTNLANAMPETDFVKQYILGCNEANSFTVIGDGASLKKFDTLIPIIKSLNIPTGFIFKPRADINIIKERIKIAEDLNALFVGIDIDAVSLTTMDNKHIASKTFTPKEIETLVSSTSLPFILKGILSLKDTEIIKDLGLQYLWVSNHGGRVLESHPSTISVLPKIRQYYPDAKIIFDGGIRSGEDVFKALYLGADIVAIGRPMIFNIIGGGASATADYLNGMKLQLQKVMKLTNCKTLKDIPHSKAIPM